MKYASQLLKEIDKLADRLEKAEAKIEQLTATVSRMSQIENRSRGLRGLTPRQFEAAFYLMHLGSTTKVAKVIGVSYAAVAQYMVYVRDQLDIVRGARTKATLLRVVEAFKTLDDDAYPTLSGGKTKEKMEKIVNDYKELHP